MKASPLLTACAVCILAIASAMSAQAVPSTVKPPVYPLAARAAGIDGPVKLEGVITKEGKMRDLKVLSGPPELRQAAIDAVMQWTYKPYRNFGRLVEVDTTVTVNFNLGSPKEKAEAQAKAKAQLAQALKASQDAQAVQAAQTKQSQESSQPSEAKEPQPSEPKEA